MTAQDVMKWGFSGKSVGEILKQSKKWSNDEIQEFLQSGKKPECQKIEMITGSVWEWLCKHPCLQNLFSRDTGDIKIASNGEKRRWLENKNVKLNGDFPSPDSLMPSKVTELIFFPGSKFQCTIC